MQNPKVTAKPKQTLMTGPPTQKYHFADFDVIREEWNKYKLEDEATVKSKFVLVNVMIEKSLEEFLKKAKEKKDPKIGMWIWIQSRNVLGVEAQEKLRGPPSAPYTPQELQGSIIKKDIDFEVIKERRNEYKLKNGIVLRVRHSPLEISKTSKFDSQGLPIYIVNSTANLTVWIPEKAQKKLARLKTQRVHEG